MNKVEAHLAARQASAAQEFPADRALKFLMLLAAVREKYAENHAALEKQRSGAAPADTQDKTVFQLLQNGDIDLGFEREILAGYKQVFHGYEAILNDLNELVSSERGRRIIIATHMHAGDGNVHVNIPVHSSDYQMMQEADEAATHAMLEAIRLGGVVSGEHGIGLTKLKFIDKSVLDAYQEYKKQADPGNTFNPGKLNAAFPLYRVYTPSFNLLESEAIILESTDIEKLSTTIAACVRCGKCKTVCNTHYPARGMMYNPRNKILAVGLITEAILFSAQTLDMKSFTHFTKLREISDHCTVCHKCQVPCPVKIDFGDVSLTTRELLVHRKKSSPKFFTSAALFYLSRKKYLINKLFRLGLLNMGYSAQRVAAMLNKPVAAYSAMVFPKLGELLKTPFPRSGERSLRELFRLNDTDAFYCFENPDKPVVKSVVYFPGCGSERMFPEISIAAVAMLYNSGVRVVIPHEFLCCGYPFLANGRTDQADLKSYENRVLFHRIADTIGYMNIDAVLVSCGTCHEMLGKYEIENIFSGATLMDVNEYLIREKLYAAAGAPGKRPYYHAPCHDPLKLYGQEKTFQALYGQCAVEIPDCCGEAGTLALSRPDISNTLRVRKRNNITAAAGEGDIEILTTCPSCVLGLSKTGNGRSVTGKSLIVYNAEHFFGKDWKKQFIRTVKKNGVEKIIF
jgi:Fe-S oxidoreductase